MMILIFSAGPDDLHLIHDAYFKCGGDWPPTVPLSQVCDGTSQCADGSDEVADFCAGL